MRNLSKQPKKIPNFYPGNLSNTNKLILCINALVHKMCLVFESPPHCAKCNVAIFPVLEIKPNGKHAQ